VAPENVTGKTEKQPNPAAGPATGKKSPKLPCFQPLFSIAPGFYGCR
jgi:hypothetical protein